MLNRIRQAAKEPLVQFIVIGACIYGAYELYGEPEETGNVRSVTVDENRIAGFISQWQGRWKRPPTRPEIDGVIEAYIREEILYRQAIAIGLNKDDAITRRRMAQKLEFLTNDIALFEQPKEGELEQYFADNIDQFRNPDLITFSHVFINPDVHNDATLGHADKLLKQVQTNGKPDKKTLSVGDRFMSQSHFEQATKAQVQRQMGSGFSDAVLQLEPGRWHGPILSGFGVHLIYVYGFEPGSAPKFTDIEQRILARWQEQKQKKFSADFLENLKKSYTIKIAQIPETSLLAVNAKMKAGNKSNQVAIPTQ